MAHTDSRTTTYRIIRQGVRGGSCHRCGTAISGRTDRGRTWLMISDAEDWAVLCHRCDHVLPAGPDTVQGDTIELVKEPTEQDFARARAATEEYLTELGARYG